MAKTNHNIIFIAGAPGTGKSSVAHTLQKKLKSPCFEFCWIPEFRYKGSVEINYEEEEGIAFENLVLVTKNYIKHGFNNIIITDLEDKRIAELHRRFKKEKYILFTLTLHDDEILKSRVMNKDRTSKYRDVKSAIQINDEIISRELLPHEVRIDTTKISFSKVVKEVMSYLE